MHHATAETAGHKVYSGGHCICYKKERHCPISHIISNHQLTMQKPLATEASESQDIR